MDEDGFPALSPRGRRTLAALITAWLLLMGLADIWSRMPLEYMRTLPAGAWLPVLSGVAMAVVVFAPVRVRIEGRAAVAAVLSLTVTGWLAWAPEDGPGSGTLESAVLLVLLARTARTARPWAALGLCLLLGATIVAGPARSGLRYAAHWSGFSSLLLLAAVAAAGFGCHLRMLDDRRARAIIAVREGERLQLAHDLHDFVAHHVTGMVVQAQAALAIREHAPEQVEPLLRGIEKAGNETLDSMHRLVRVLREQDRGTVRPDDLLAELALLIARFGQAGRPTARLDVSAEARAAALDPEVETTVHRLVQEALTNITRHAPGARDARVSLTAGPGTLTAEVVNGPPSHGAMPPGGRSGGFGLIGLRERIEAVGGTLTAGTAPDGGWQVTGTFPVRPQRSVTAAPGLGVSQA
ncbi:sensor histidine kinase [Streptomyces inhibens]|uniref:sensor histidine kinase n=1 Tax=Streptomyces inhibens TaxID=2293571 RepID=UPI0037BDFCDF